MQSYASGRGSSYPAKILIIDDDPEHLHTISERLRVEGYSIITTNCGKEALNLIGLEGPDLVLLDNNKSEMDGMEVLAALKQDHQEVPVVMVSGSWDEEDGRKAFDLGAFDYITKPVNMDYLKLAILSCLTMEEERSDSNPVTLSGETPLCHETLGGRAIEITFFPFRIGRESRPGKARFEQRRPNSTPNNDLYLEDTPPYRLSREHFQIEYRDRQYIIRDRGSALGLHVNGTPIGGSHPEKVQKLHKGENLIVVGGLNSPLRFRLTV